MSSHSQNKIKRTRVALRDPSVLIATKLGLADGALELAGLRAFGLKSWVGLSEFAEAVVFNFGGVGCSLATLVFQAIANSRSGKLLRTQEAERLAL